MKLRTRLVVLVLAALAPVMVVETVEQVEQFKRQEEAAFQEAQRQAEVYAGRLQQMSIGFRELLIAMSLNPVVQNRDPEGCTAYAKALQEHFRNTFTVGGVNEQGQLYCLGVPNTYAGKADDRWYFKLAMATNGFAAGEFAVARNINHAVFHYAYPTRAENGSPNGVVFASLSLVALAQRLSETPLPQDSSLIVTDRNGTVLVQLPDTSRKGTKVSSALMALLSRDKPGAEVVTLERQPSRIVGYVPLNSVAEGVAIALSFPREAVMRPVQTMVVRRALTVFGAVALALLLAWLVARAGLYRPLSRLTETARQWRSGDLHARTRLGQLRDAEFGELGATLDEMAKNLALRQEQLSQANEEMRRSRDDAVQANKAKTYFVAAASHDLRQPLQAMHLNIALLAARKEENNEGDTVERLRKSVANLVDLLTSLLDVSQLDAGLITPTFVDFDLQKVLQTIGDEFGAAAQLKKQEFYIQPCRCAVRSDKVLLGRMIRNLISNAIKYTPVGGSVKVYVRHRGDKVYILVADSGEGIPPEKQEVIFEEFHQLGNPQRNPSFGLGLGLAIVKRMSILLNHPVALKSESGKGTTFTITVPMAEHAAPEPLPEDTPVLEGRALVVDNDSLGAESLAELLRTWGLEVAVAEDAPAAVRELEDPARRWSVIIADYRLPNRSGLEVLQHARKLFPQLLSVLLMNDSADAQQVREKHPELPVIQKPINLKVLSATLASLAPAEPQPTFLPDDAEAHASPKDESSS
ncbi:ATP-binding protein [Aquabacterium sp. A7-Y]|uniref:ATP-binding protein n=1 Tax=Aquabacterium sp. A7-Y TaxID=1349605 RepID=UPI00223DD152|nr:ATP-binding protein [Aquabacterium sp. A7-Y]MCW7538317.1 ATP-binding protein [Aquabacterium sp. A7-Y]